ncbi:pilus assembly protein [Nitrincola alkalilacustris]|uniref:pilus assembly protein n=1 Tax=Nitrincola alkalilacustris TaxID=1571224 RepID=UPI00124F142F|nr:PilC/PilY family type IV pilus protein [Nitrincola alkalilacustris]
MSIRCSGSAQLGLTHNSGLRLWQWMLSMLLLIGLLSATASRVQASECEITIGPTFYGANVVARQNHTIATLSEILNVQLVTGTSCNVSRYGFGDPDPNTFWTSNRCRGTFTITGLEADCAVSGSGEVSQNPLFLTTPVEANLMFLLDDSGSMHFETIGDELTDTFEGTGSWVGRMVPYVYPHHQTTGTPAGVSFQDCIYSSGTSTSCDYWRSSTYRAARLHLVPRFEADNRWAAYFRSSHVNPVYYNPDVTYLPWVDAFGSSWSNADPQQALHNPSLPEKGWRNLTIDNTQRACWVRDNATENSSDANLCDTANLSFWPATYFQYNSGDLTEASSYTRVEIRSGNTYARSEDRFDCDDHTACTYQEEIQNFANWYSYHRSRILAARGGIGRAFSQLPASLRVGFGTINQGSNNVDGLSTSSIIRGVRRFASSDRDEFFGLLYDRDVPIAGTPLRNALNDAGTYFSRSDNDGPWSESPGQGVDSDHLECRQSYSILMTDGYWNGGGPSLGNVDNTTGPTITAPDGSTYQYTAADPYRDSRSNTLADVAMHYWNRDLRPAGTATGLDNRVPTSNRNEAFWQHMVTYGVGLGVEGSIDPEVAWQAVIDGDPISWPDPAPFSAFAAKLDDLLHAGINSRGGFFSAKDPNEFSKQFTRILEDVVARTEASSVAVASNSTQLSTGTRIYQGRFNSADWSGELLAYGFDPYQTGDAQFSLLWNAADHIPDPNDRKIFTINPATNAGVKFEWSDGITADQATHLISEELVNYLRGSDEDEIRNGGSFRDRLSPLGDIINSPPVYVGEELNFGYANNNDLAASYITFLEQNKALAETSRRATIYVGANDGMVHAFDADTGVEHFAFVPNAVIPTMPELADQNYSHRFFVDGEFNVSHIQRGGQWRTVLVGGLGAGGNSIFALDVTEPGAFNDANVLWEFTDPDLGYTFGRPTVARMQTANNAWKWVAVFGNGYHSNDRTAALYIVDMDDGSLIKKIEVDDEGGNGLSAPTLVANNERVITEAYAGDLKGNLWKFDFTGNGVNQWDVAFKQGQNSLPLFKALGPSPDENVQPITSRPAVGGLPEGGRIVIFGTGKFFEVGDNDTSGNPPLQSIYGIKDLGQRVQETDRSTLVEQEIIWEGPSPNGEYNLRVVTKNEVLDIDKGWFMDLVHDNNRQGERIVSQPLIHLGRVIFATIIPSQDPCDFGGTSWLMEIDPKTGGRLPDPVFDINDDQQFNEDDMISVNGELVPPSGIQSNVGIIDTPTIIDDGELEFKVLSGSSGNMETVTEPGSGGGDRDRISWRQLR